MKQPWPTLIEERRCWKQSQLLIGVDEVGRGALAGPVVAGAVAFAANHSPIPGIRDSKQLRPITRIELCHHIINTTTWWGLGIGTVEEINQYGITYATALAMKRAIAEIGLSHPSVLIDGLSTKPLTQLIPHAFRTLIKADCLCYSVAAASIVAKCYRDALMIGLGQEYPAYSWDNNKGYGTQTHLKSLKQLGVTRFHRTRYIELYALPA